MKIIGSTGVGEAPYQAWEWDPFVPVDWRARDAGSLIAGEATEWADADDPYVAAYAEYLRSLAAADVEPTQAAVAAQGAAIRTAHELAARDDPLEWEIRARLLAGETDAEIGGRCTLPPDTIAWYEHVFFAVRASRKAEKYLLSHAVGNGIHRGFLDREIGSFWAWIALGGGSSVLNIVIETFHAARQPGEPAALSIYLRPGITPNLQALVASMILPYYGRAGEAWRQFHLQLMEADAADDQDRRALLRERARDWLIRCARNYLAGKPLPRFHRRRQVAHGRNLGKVQDVAGAFGAMLSEVIGTGAGRVSSRSQDVVQRSAYWREPARAQNKSAGHP